MLKLSFYSKIFKFDKFQYTALINKKDSILEEQEKLAKEIEAFNKKINEVRSIFFLQIFLLSNFKTLMYLFISKFQIADCSPEDLIMKLKKTRKELKETRAKLAPMEGKEVEN